VDLNTRTIVRTTLEVLRSVFLGAASRHDAVRNRWVIAEGGYERFLEGPDIPEPGNKVIASRSFDLRDSVLVPVTHEQKEQILQDRPDARIGSFPDDSRIFYIVARGGPDVALDVWVYERQNCSMPAPRSSCEPRR